jgi:hypothetical protein
MEAITHSVWLRPVGPRAFNTLIFTIYALFAAVGLTSYRWPPSWSPRPGQTSATWAGRSWPAMRAQTGTSS